MTFSLCYPRDLNSRISQVGRSDLFFAARRHQPADAGLQLRFLFSSLVSGGDGSALWI